MELNQLESIKKDSRLLAELGRKFFPETGNLQSSTRAIIDEAFPPQSGFDPASEAIILKHGRPALLVKNDTFQLPESNTWQNRLLPAKTTLEKILPSVGRIELIDHFNLQWVGTGWFIAEDIIVTNRHVALAFAKKLGNKFDFRKNPYTERLIRAKIDTMEEHKNQSNREFIIEKVLFIADDADTKPDMAFLKVEKNNDLPQPIELSTKKYSAGDMVVTVGYPARDDRNSLVVMSDIFDDIFNVKRLQPGTIVSYPANGLFFTHDCSTLGGNSGSVVVDLSTGQAIGLHFGGIFQEVNYAVKAKILLDQLTKLHIQIPVKVEPIGDSDTSGSQDVVVSKSSYQDRKGYNPDFLGTDHKVPLPQFTGQSNGKKALLDYTHFSIDMNTDRRMARYTVSNIDGLKLRRVPRSSDKWILDPRIDGKYQFGNELYKNNNLDRGHLVRRLDPVWGSEEEAKKANDDTFHYTNSTPQHKDFNQKSWNDLEDWILDNAGVHDLKLSVFTGPVFADWDVSYRKALLPQEYWKVVAMVRSDNQKLSITAYLLSQKDFLADLEGFVFGEYKTYQLPVARIEQLTQLDFGDLKLADPKRKSESIGTYSEVLGFEDLVF